MGLEGADGVFVEGGGEDHGGRVLNKLEHFEAVDLRHLDIQKNEVGVELLDGLEPFKTVVAFLQDGDIGIRLQIFADDEAREGFVVDKNRGDRLQRRLGGRLGSRLGGRLGGRLG